MRVKVVHALMLTTAACRFPRSAQLSTEVTRGRSKPPRGSRGARRARVGVNPMADPSVCQSKRRRCWVVTGAGGAGSPDGCAPPGRACRRPLRDARGPDRPRRLGGGTRRGGRRRGAAGRRAADVPRARRPNGGDTGSPPGTERVGRSGTGTAGVLADAQGKVRGRGKARADPAGRRRLV